MTVIAEPLSNAAADTLFSRISNWGRYGSDDERGTLNELGPAQTLAAIGLVREGISLSLAHPLATEPGPENPRPVQHYMLRAGDLVGSGSGGSADYVGMTFHGLAVTHLDALCHVMRHGKLYNGFSSKEVTSSGANRGAITPATEHGLVGRGVLLDVPAALGRDWLEPGEAITPADLEATEQVQGITVQPGDLLFVRTGRAARNAAQPLPPAQPNGLRAHAGLHHSSLPWLAERRIAVLGGDGFSDVVPEGPDPGAMVFHAVAIPALGLHLLDNAALEPLAAACAERRRWAFLCVLAPLRLDRGTGSPLNPIAVF